MPTVWNKKSGTVLAEISEQNYHSVDLPIEKNVSVSLISGNIPAGMTLSDTAVQGVPDEVPRNTDYRFVLRASYNNETYDRTYTIRVTGEDAPEWQTPPDLLPIGQNGNTYILDSSYIDFQLEATDSDTAAGQKLSYFIPSKGGELPPGISLTEDGRLVGVVEPILALEKDAGNGFYDSGRYDRYPFDFGVQKILNDNKTQQPSKLNRYYEFIVCVSDGNTISSRRFKIFVVGDDFLRADNAITPLARGVYTADNTYIRTPIWTTKSNLGIFRANNYLTLFLDTIDPNDVPGTIVYEIVPYNEDGSESILPPGTGFDKNTGEIFGRVPYQSAITKEYVFTINAKRFETRRDIIVLQKFNIDKVDRYSINFKINKTNLPRSEIVGRSFFFEDEIYTVTEVNDRNSEYDLISIDSPLQDKIPQGSEIDLGTASKTSTEIAESSKTFRVSLIGEIDSTIEWITDPYLGKITSSSTSLFRVKAETTVKNSIMLYTLEQGQLPPGLDLSVTGEIVGTVQNDSVSENSEYEFTVKAQDQFGFSAITRTFVIKVTKAEFSYNDVYLRPFLSKQQRINFNRIVSDPDVVDAESVYRAQDPQYGIQKTPNILLYSGLEDSDIENYVAAAAQSASRRRFKIKDVKKAVASMPGESTVLYELVYLDVYDPNDTDKFTTPKIDIPNSQDITVDSQGYNSNYNADRSKIGVETRYSATQTVRFDSKLDVITRSGSIDTDLNNLGRRDQDIKIEYDVGTSTNIVYRPAYVNPIKADATAVRASSTKISEKNITSTTELRDMLRGTGNTDIVLLPLWMRTPQPGTLEALGYTLAIPLIYVLPGEADRVIRAFKSKANFKQFDLDIDRLVVSPRDATQEETYILFANYEYNLA